MSQQRRRPQPAPVQQPERANSFDVTGLTATGANLMGTLNGGTMGGLGTPLGVASDTYGLFSGNASPLDYLSTANSWAGMAADAFHKPGMSNTFGRIGNGLDIIDGAMTAADSNASTSDRVMGGTKATGASLSLGANLMGHQGLFAAGSGVGPASTLAASNPFTAVAAGGAPALATTGLLLSSAYGGVKIGQGINTLANSDQARQDPGSVGGTHETYADWWQNLGTTVQEKTGNEALGIAVGTTGATFGTIADAGVGLWNMVTGGGPANQSTQSPGSPAKGPSPVTAQHGPPAPRSAPANKQPSVFEQRLREELAGREAPATHGPTAPTSAPANRQPSVFEQRLKEELARQEAATRATDPMARWQDTIRNMAPKY